MLADRVRMGSGKLKFYDNSGSPGSNMLIAGNKEEGFFGEVPASEFITGDTLASLAGISEGTSLYSSAGWLKFVYKGEIQFVAKKPIRYKTSWNAIYEANCVYGDKTVVIDGKNYKVTLMRALEPTNDPKTVSSAVVGEINHYSEWNRLMCQIHYSAISGSWGSSSANIESDIGILRHNLGSGSQGMYSNADLIIGSGNGRYSLCQEMSTGTHARLARGGLRVADASSSSSSDTNAWTGWRPVLRLVKED